MSAETKPLVGSNNNTSIINFDNFKKLGHSVGQAMFATIALVVTVTTGALILVSKLFTFFIPKDYSKKIDDLQSIALYVPVIGSLLTAKFGYGVVGEFQDPEKRKTTEKAIDDFFKNDKNQIKESFVERMDKFACAHVNGSNYEA